MPPEGIRAQPVTGYIVNGYDRLIAKAVDSNNRSFFKSREDALDSCGTFRRN